MKLQDIDEKREEQIQREVMERRMTCAPIEIVRESFLTCNHKDFIMIFCFLYVSRQMQLPIPNPKRKTEKTIKKFLCKHFIKTYVLYVIFNIHFLLHLFILVNIFLISL